MILLIIIWQVWRCLFRSQDGKVYRTSNASVMDTFCPSLMFYIVVLIDVIFMIFPAKLQKRSRLCTKNKY